MAELYSDLLRRQSLEMETLHSNWHKDHKALVEIQRESPYPDQHEPEKQRIFMYYKGLENQLKASHEQERRNFFGEDPPELREKRQDQNNDGQQM